MITINPADPDGDHERLPATFTYSAERVIVGHCPNPACGWPLVVFNDREVWPLAACRCGWTGPTTALINRVRRERELRP